MPQKLILPINKCRVTASYKTAAYLARFKFSHFGVDMVSSLGQSTVYASGNGSVLATGWDNVLGNVVVVCYSDAVNHHTGEVHSVIARYYHLSQILVSPGVTVDADTRLAQYGNTGKYSAGAHLHIEFDSNTATPRASRTLGNNSNLILASSADTTIDPFHLLHCKSGPPDNQEITVDASQHQGQYYAMPACAQIPRV